MSRHTESTSHTDDGAAHSGSPRNNQDFPALSAMPPTPLDGVGLDTLNVTVDYEVPTAALRTLSNYTTASGEVSHLWKKAEYKNLTVFVTAGRTKISGSVCRFVYGTSLATCGLRELLLALQEISEVLGVPLSVLLDGRLTRIDLAANLVVDHHPRAYVEAMWMPARTRRLDHAPDSVTFKNTLREVNFYAKIAEAPKTTTVPERYLGEHVLRAEVRFMRTKKEFDREVSPRLLLDAQFFDGAKERWARHVAAVRLRRDFSLAHPTRASDHRDLYALRGIEATGGPERALKRIDVAQAADVVTPNQAYRQRKWVRQLRLSETLTTESDLATEFYEAVRCATAT